MSNLLFKKPSKEQMDICAEEGFRYERFQTSIQAGLECNPIDTNCLSEAICRSGPNHLVPGASLEFALEDSSVTRLTRVSDGWIEDYDAVKV